MSDQNVDSAAREETAQSWMDGCRDMMPDLRSGTDDTQQAKEPAGVQRMSGCCSCSPGEAENREETS